MKVIFETSMGEIEAELYPTQAPKTVANFVELARGTRSWIDPKTRESVTRPLYDGTIFHRVIPKFMIQGGDPKGNGTGGPGYQFEDECVPELQFDRPGKLAMANAGPGTNGSQFFITQAPCTHLNGRHTIFGAVTKGHGVIKAIAETPRDASDRPHTPVVLKSVKFIEE